MKQVIVRVRDCRPTYIKTLHTYHFYGVSNYKHGVFDCVKDLLPGQEIYIKVGNQYAKFILYEEILEYMQMNHTTFDEELEYQLVEDDSLLYHITNYLPLFW